MKKITSFIEKNKGRKDSIGKLCTDILKDEKFKIINTEQEFIDYANSVSCLHPDISDAILDLKKELGL